MRTSHFALSAFAILGSVYGLPTTDASVGSSLAKRDGLPYDLNDYLDCLDIHYNRASEF